MEQWHYFVGDIHGCYDEYMDIEKRIHRHAKRRSVAPLIVSVGDMIDRGPDSASVVQHFRKGVEAGTHTVVLGNHEEFLLVALWEFAPWSIKLGPLPKGIRDLQQRHALQKGSARVLRWEEYRQFYRFMWITQGGYETLGSFGINPHEPSEWKLPEEDLVFLLQLPLFWQNDDFIVTHALPEPEDIVTVRNFKDKGPRESKRRWERRLERYKMACYHLLWRRPPQTEPPDPDRLHISGHTSYDRVRRVSQAQTLQIDTGCVYQNRLTAWCGEDNTYFRENYKG